MKNLRSHGKSTIVWVLMGMLVLGLGGFGVTSFTSGISSIGSVGKTDVTADEYARALSAQMNAYQQQTGQPMTAAQAEQMGVTRMVQSQLFTAAALDEQARKIGISVGDKRVAEVVMEAPAFRSPNGSFDRAAYREVLRRERMTEGDFEAIVRKDEGRALLRDAVVGGIAAPQPLADTTVQWLLERRDVSWRELTADQLPEPIADPDEETLKAWHSANAERFTAPEVRKITYVWLTPEMLAPDVQLDEQALRDAYQAKIAEYQQPERRLVSRLVMPSQEAAEGAKAQIDAGEASFEEIVQQRGLSLEDVDQGAVSKEALGDAGEAVFALEQPGTVGPIETNLGPALFGMHAILDPVDVSFEDAREELRAEAAVDRATRTIAERGHDFEDLLAGGTTLEQVAEETELELGTIEWSADVQPEGGSIGGYQAFRDLAAEVTADDFPTLGELDDGGVFALRLDEVVPPSLKPFESIRDEVRQDWRQGEAHRQLLAFAEEQRLQDTTSEAPKPAPAASTGAGGVVQNPGVQPAEPAPQPVEDVEKWAKVADIVRDGWIDGAPQEVVFRAFEIAEPNEVEVVDAENRVILLRLDAIHPADMEGEDAKRVIDVVKQRIGQSLQADMFDYYARAAQQSGGLTINQQAINAINTQAQ